MSPETKEYDQNLTQKQEENKKQRLTEQNIKPENADTVKRLGFNLEKGEKIDQKTIEGKMGEQFDSMKNSVGNNPESQAKLDAIKQTFSQTLGKETDIDKQLELCEEFLKEYDIAASTEKGEYAERAKIQSKNMEKESRTDAKKTEDKGTEMKKMIAEITELQLKEETRRNKEKQRQLSEQDSQKSAEVAEATGNINNIPGWPGPKVS